MKKALWIFLTLALLLGLASCTVKSRTGNKTGDKTDKTEKTEKYDESDDFVGDWLSYLPTEFDSTGMILNADPVTLTLEEDGTAHCMGETGTWKYRKGDVLEISFENLEYYFGTVYVREYNGYVMMYMPGVGAPPPYGEFYRAEDTVTAETAYGRLAGEWYTQEGDVLYFGHDGTALLNGESMNWELYRMGPYVILEYGDGFTYLDLSSNAFTNYSLYIDYGPFISEQCATLITVDNWREYFGDRLEDVFEIRNEIQYGVDEWGEVYGIQWVDQQFALKDPENQWQLAMDGDYWHMQGGLTVEYACGAEAERIWWDEATKSAVREQFAPSLSEGEKITVTLGGWRTDLEGGFYEVDSRHTYEGDEYGLPLSGEILRMKGLLFKTEFLSQLENGN